MAQFTANPEQLRTHLLEANAMSNELTQLQTQADAMRTELADRPTLASVEELRLRLDALSAVAAPPPRGSYLKVNSPQEFKGARKAARNFVAQCELNFDASPELFHSDQRKIVFLASFLRNSAFDWYQVLSDELRSGTFAAFKEAFFRTYSDGDLHTKAVEKLYALAQRKGSVSEYLTQFDTWAGCTEYNDVALGDAFYCGLSECIKDMITAAGRPKDLTTLKSEALKYDQHVQERLGQPRSDSDAPNTTYSDDPMDIASVHTGRNKKGVKAPLTADEKERRRRDKLCGYCAKADCPGGVSQDPALCPLVIAKEDAKRQRHEGYGNHQA
jgi:hypothetical protein